MRTGHNRLNAHMYPVFQLTLFVASNASIWQQKRNNVCSVCGIVFSFLLRSQTTGLRAYYGNDCDSKYLLLTLTVCHRGDGGMRGCAGGTLGEGGGEVGAEGGAGLGLGQGVREVRGGHYPRHQALTIGASTSVNLLEEKKEKEKEKRG